MSEIILVIAEQRGSRLNRASFETIAAAQSIARESGWAVEVALLGDRISEAAAELATRKIQRVHKLESAALAIYTSDAYVHALKAFIQQKQPKLVLFPHTYQVRDFAPRLALALGVTLISDATGYKVEGDKILFVRQMFQGKLSADVSFAGTGPWLATIQIGAFRGDSAEAGSAEIETVTVAVAEGVQRVHPLEVFQEAKQAVDLTKAEIIVGVGRGIKEEGNIALAQELADVLGAELAASRPICDSGWLPLDRQVGSSGQTVTPKLYLAVGISGAIQHQVGMKGARTIIAINKDAEAPIFEIADYGVVGDLFEVVPALIEEIKKAKAGA
jgi:electron transfer flavoprotein alpha subunit